MFESFKRFITNPIAILGMAGFSTTVIACYGPAPTGHYEEVNSAGEAILRCVDGTQTTDQCEQGCIKSKCIEIDLPIDAPCHEDQYVDTCIYRDEKASSADTSKKCVDGVVKQVECELCTQESDGVLCANNIVPAEAPSEDAPTDEM